MGGEEMGVGWLQQCVPPPPPTALNFAIWARGGWKLRHVDTPEPQSSPRHCVKWQRAPRVDASWETSADTGWVETIIVCYLPPPAPRFYSSLSGKEESRKETLNHRRLAARHAKMAAAPQGFKVPGKACVLPWGARAAALPPSARLPVEASQSP